MVDNLLITLKRSEVRVRIKPTHFNIHIIIHVKRESLFFSKRNTEMAFRCVLGPIPIAPMMDKRKTVSSKIGTSENSEMHSTKESNTH